MMQNFFCRWFDDVKQGKYVVVVVVSESSPHQHSWIIPAYITKKLTHGEIEWKKN